jgi:hypothetical protein
MLYQSCSVFHQESHKIGFAFLWFVYSFLRILQDSAKTATLFKILFCEQAPGKNSDPAIGSLGAGSGEDRRNATKGGTGSAGEGRGRAQGLTYDRFRGLDGPEGVPARGLGGVGRYRPLERPLQWYCIPAGSMHGACSFRGSQRRYRCGC